ncbi:MAG: 4-(cytidine 5'-diphospho)-2-C-methyl-D-erythritol kinase [Terrimicrobiaceae bacterium]
MTIQAPAKVNLALRILAKRADGFHDIETLMVPISLADDLEIEVSAGTGIEMVCDQPDIPAGPGNLAWRAAEAFQRHTGLGFHTRLALRKRIPHGAGLGGGSSDAAATLKALDRLNNTALGPLALEGIAASIGSDVPFFIRAQPALCRGRGELMQVVDGIEPAGVLLLKPPFPVPTGWAYQAWTARRVVAGHRQFHGSVELANDLETPVFQKYLLLPAIKAWLLEQNGVAAAMMSGSGSTLFAILRGDAGTLAERARERFGRNLWTAEARI